MAAIPFSDLQRQFQPRDPSERSMSKTRIGRIIAAVIPGYVANGILVVATEQLLSLLTGAAGPVKPAYYFVIDLVSQCLYTIWPDTCAV